MQPREECQRRSRRRIRPRLDRHCSEWRPVIAPSANAMPTRVQDTHLAGTHDAIQCPANGPQPQRRRWPAHSMSHTRMRRAVSPSENNDQHAQGQPETRLKPAKCSKTRLKRMIGSTLQRQPTEAVPRIVPKLIAANGRTHPGLDHQQQRTVTSGIASS